MPEQEKTYNEIAGQRISRIEAISDGVFAVAMTLLVLDIHVPLREAIHSEHDVMMAFCFLTPKLLTYFTSFMTLGIFWNGQSLQYNYIKRSDRDLTWVALFFLMVVSLVPFTTAFLSEHFSYRFSIGLYWLNIFLLGLIVYIQWVYAWKRGYVENNLPETIAVNKALRRRIIMAQALYALGALLCFISTYLSIALIIIVQLNYALGLTSRGKRRK
ncbi:MAG: DUF1211 domain-containing protein [Bacteroidetes bacterium]|nr:DUF1211 domain-containing protein [Bacteroidota bacterium]